MPLTFAYNERFHAYKLKELFELVDPDFFWKIFFLKPCFCSNAKVWNFKSTFLSKRNLKSKFWLPKIWWYCSGNWFFGCFPLFLAIPKCDVKCEHNCSGVNVRFLTLKPTFETKSIQSNSLEWQRNTKWQQVEWNQKHFWKFWSFTPLISGIHKSSTPGSPFWKQCFESKEPAWNGPQKFHEDVPLKFLKTSFHSSEVLDKIFQSEIQNVQNHALMCTQLKGGLGLGKQDIFTSTDPEKCNIFFLWPTDDNCVHACGKVSIASMNMLTSCFNQTCTMLWANMRGPTCLHACTFPLFKFQEGFGKQPVGTRIWTEKKVGGSTLVAADKCTTSQIFFQEQQEELVNKPVQVWQVKRSSPSWTDARGCTFFTAWTLTHIQACSREVTHLWKVSNNCLSCQWVLSDDRANLMEEGISGESNTKLEDLRTQQNAWACKILQKFHLSPTCLALHFSVLSIVQCLTTQLMCSEWKGACLLPFQSCMQANLVDLFRGKCSWDLNASFLVSSPRWSTPVGISSKLWWTLLANLHQTSRWSTASRWEERNNFRIWPCRAVSIVEFNQHSVWQNIPEDFHAELFFCKMFTALWLLNIPNWHLSSNWPIAEMFDVQHYFWIQNIGDETNQRQICSVHLLLKMANNTFWSRNCGQPSRLFFFRDPQVSVTLTFCLKWHNFFCRVHRLLCIGFWGWWTMETYERLPGLWGMLFPSVFGMNCCPKKMQEVSTQVVWQWKTTMRKCWICCCNLWLIFNWPKEQSVMGCALSKELFKWILLGLQNSNRTSPWPREKKRRFKPFSPFWLRWRTSTTKKNISNCGMILVRFSKQWMSKLLLGSLERVWQNCMWICLWDCWKLALLPSGILNCWLNLSGFQLSSRMSPFSNRYWKACRSLWTFSIWCWRERNFSFKTFLKAEAPSLGITLSSVFIKMPSFIGILLIYWPKTNFLNLWRSLSTFP